MFKKCSICHNRLQHPLIVKVLRLFRRERFIITGIFLLAIAYFLLVHALNTSILLQGIKTDLALVIRIIVILIASLLFAKWKIPGSRFYRIWRNILTVLGILVPVLALLGYIWYDNCFFPDDEEWLRERMAVNVQDKLVAESVELDLLDRLQSATFSNPLTEKDLAVILDPALKNVDLYIDKNPYYKGQNSSQNLKYATGKTFHYIYQKNSIVLRSGANIRYSLAPGRDARFLRTDVVIPALPHASEKGTLKIWFEGIDGSRKQCGIFSITKESKPDIETFQYNNPLSAFWFYIKNPGVSAIPESTGWLTLNIDLPLVAGTLEIEFEGEGQAGAENIVFLGLPEVMTTYNADREKLNVIYIIADTLGQPHLDGYEFNELFSTKGAQEAQKELGSRKVVTPFINSLFDKSVYMHNIYTGGAVTRPAITSLWTSRSFTECRMPVFRNMVSDENARQFYDQNFDTLGNVLSSHGYRTAQICCNAEGHGVSGVGVDLGFDENHDYTLEASEYTANFLHIMKFMEENRNRPFFLYTHLNIPHPPRWVPADYGLPAFFESNTIVGTARMLANIRYLDARLKVLYEQMQRLGLNRNTIIVITADHSCGPHPYFRGDITDGDRVLGQLEPQEVATFHPNAVYSRPGGMHMYNEYVKIPFVMIAPPEAGIVTGNIRSVLSSLDIAPTLCDLLGVNCPATFEGQSFASALKQRDSRNVGSARLIPLTNRFQTGFIIEGRYKYWIKQSGLYTCRTTPDGSKMIQPQEHLFDLQNDPNELVNLARDNRAPELLQRMRQIMIEEFVDYPDRTWIQIPADEEGVYEIDVYRTSGTGLRYPKVFGKGITFTDASDKMMFTITNPKETAFVSFETGSSRDGCVIHVRRNGMLINEKNLLYGAEKLSFRGNPLRILSAQQCFSGRITGVTGLEDHNLEKGMVHVYRVPIIFWMEMNAEDKDIHLNPGIKEVLRGWGYIQ